VEERFEHPPKALSDLIEAEVQKRIKRQEWFYWTFLGLFAAFVTIFSISFWHAELNEVASVVEKQLSEQGTIQAKKQISDILAYSVGLSNTLSDYNKTIDEQKSTWEMRWTANAMQIEFANTALNSRLDEIKQHDNVVLKSDLDNLYVSEIITNFNGSYFELKYEPIPLTIMAYETPKGSLNVPPFLFNVALGTLSVNGKKVTFSYQQDIGCNVFVVYARKSFSK
jgi:hypothetical protein